MVVMVMAQHSPRIMEVEMSLFAGHSIGGAHVLKESWLWEEGLKKHGKYLGKSCRFKHFQPYFHESELRHIFHGNYPTPFIEVAEYVGMAHNLGWELGHLKIATRLSITSIKYSGVTIFWSHCWKIEPGCLVGGREIDLCENLVFFYPSGISMGVVVSVRFWFSSLQRKRRTWHQLDEQNTYVSNGLVVKNHQH